jgi:SAM-dependent methyltransferase
MIRALRNYLIEPAVRNLDPDSARFTVAHRDVLRQKAILRRLFVRFYHECRALDEQWFRDCPGLRLEIGSGSSFFKEVFPDVLTSDLKPLPFVDLAARAESLPFDDGSVRAIYAINVFHHLPQPRSFLRELQRVLHAGGGVVMIEPYYGPFARMLFKRLHASEGFDMAAPHWETEQTLGAMSNANQALSYIVFTRDRETLCREFPQLEVSLDRPHTHLSYILSGGLNFRQLVPNWAASPVELAEWLLSPLNRLLAIQHTIVLRKKT